MVIFSESLPADVVIFDFDGVIVDTEPLHYEAFQRVLNPIGLSYSWIEYVNRYMGFDDRDAFVETFRSSNKIICAPELRELVAQKAIAFQEVINGKVLPYPGVIELIKKLHELRIPLGISSGALLSDITPILRQLGLDGLFDVIVTADDVAKSKPDPESYSMAFNKLSLKFPSKVSSESKAIAIEDTPAGIEAARKAGLCVIAVTNSYDRKSISEAELIVDSLEELLKFSVA